MLEEWLTCQRSWLYLEPIFSSDDINQQLPEEGKRYEQMDETWRKVMKSAFNNPKVNLFFIYFFSNNNYNMIHFLTFTTFSC